MPDGWVDDHYKLWSMGLGYCRLLDESSTQPFSKHLRDTKKPKQLIEPAARQRSTPPTVAPPEKDCALVPVVRPEQPSVLRPDLPLQQQLQILLPHSSLFRVGVVQLQATSGFQGSTDRLIDTDG